MVWERDVRLTFASIRLDRYSSYFPLQIRKVDISNEDFDYLADGGRFSSILRKMEHEDLGEDPCAIEDLATTVHALPLPPEDLMRARGPG